MTLRLRLEAETERFKDVDGLKQEHNELMNVRGAAKASSTAHWPAFLTRASSPPRLPLRPPVPVAARRASNAHTPRPERRVPGSGSHPPVRDVQALGAGAGRHEGRSQAGGPAPEAGPAGVRAQSVCVAACLPLSKRGGWHWLTPRPLLQSSSRGQQTRSTSPCGTAARPSWRS